MQECKMFYENIFLRKKRKEGGSKRIGEGNRRWKKEDVEEM